MNFVVAGAGGAALYDLRQEDYARSTVKEKQHGFAVIEVDRQALNVRLVNSEGEELGVLELTQ
ncbi:MAG: hypothetical protein GEV06_26845 [Luteitalea sp.]|nr:hypothetical protein [Luteitalea sp.]